MRRVVGLLALGLLGLLLWQTPRSPSAPTPPVQVQSAPPPATARALPVARPTQAAQPTEARRGTTWVVLRVAPQGADVVTRVHKDALPYHVAGSPTATRFRLRDADGAELTGPVDWPQLCDCARTESHTHGCVRRPHTGSVRLRLPRLHSRTTVVIERRDPSRGWRTLESFEVDA